MFFNIFAAVILINIEDAANSYFDGIVLMRLSFVHFHIKYAGTLCGDTNKKSSLDPNFGLNSVYSLNDGIQPFHWLFGNFLLRGIGSMGNTMSAKLGMLSYQRMHWIDLRLLSIPSTDTTKPFNRIRIWRGSCRFGVILLSLGPEKHWVASSVDWFSVAQDGQEQRLSRWSNWVSSCPLEVLGAIIVYYPEG